MGKIKNDIMGDRRDVEDVYLKFQQDLLTILCCVAEAECGDIAAGVRESCGRLGRMPEKGMDCLRPTLAL